MKKILHLFLFLLLFVLLLYPLSKIFMSSLAGNTTLTDYKYLKEDSLDVLFVGDSDIHANISPMEIYDKTGITSYDYSTASASNLLSYYLLQESLKTQHPKVVVMDVASIFGYKEQKSFTHVALDNIPIDDVKINAINDNYYGFNNFDKLGFIVPYFYYHARWSELSFNDLFKSNHQSDKAFLKGFNVTYNVKSASNDYMEDNNESTDIHMDQANYIVKSMQYCKERGIEFILISTPNAFDWSDGRYQAVSNWAKENGINYIDFNTMTKEMGIDMNVDSRDGGIHLNYFGAKKFSEYLAYYLQDTYQLESHKDDDNYMEWDNDSQLYDAYVIDLDDSTDE